MADIYNETKVLHYPNMVVRVHFPDITDEEQKKRMEAIRKAAVNLLLSVERGKAKA